MKIFNTFLLFLLFTCALRATAVNLPADSISLVGNKVQRTDSLLKTIDLLHDKANEIENLSEKGFNLDEIKTGLPSIIRDIRTLKTNLNSNVQVMDMRSLQTFATLLEQSHDQLNEWRSVLLGYNQQLVNMQTEIQGLHQNKLLIAFQSDSLFVKLYTTELNSIEASWNKAKQLNTKNLKEISDLQASVTIYYYQSGDLQKELKTQIRNYAGRVMGNEYPFIWKSYTTNVDKEALKFLNASLLTQRQLITEYLKNNIGYHAFLGIAILALYIYWVRKNRNKLLTEGKSKEWLDFTKDATISAFPLLPGLIVVFNLALFFDIDPPQAYVALLQLLLFIMISIFIFRHWNRQDKIYWTKIGLSFILFIGLNGVFHPGTGVRLVLIALNVFLAFNALYFIRNKSTVLQLSKFARQVSYIVLILNILAIILNITGRVTLARVMTNTAIVGFIQIISLLIFTNIVKAVFFLQAHTASVVKHGVSVINYEKLNNSILRLLSAIVVILWFVVFTSNMNLYNGIIEGLGKFLFQPRTVGSTSFTIGNILLFFFVIYLAALAQKYVGYIFGENQGYTSPGERKGSKVVVTKLIIIIVGFLLAVLVSGLPVDKITVILGAFGVGIGLGLQTIVNNFVSGIILIFERPLQIGDYVEVSGYKGWVNDIGIRATRLSSSEGAEILVPNGTILSGNLVNWTLNNAQIRLELVLKIAPQSKVNEAKELINTILNEEEDVVKNRTPEIFNQSVNEGAVELKVWFWIGQVSRQQMVRSNVITNIYATFEKHEIKLL